MEMGRKKTLPSDAGFALDLPSIAGFACSITLLLTGLVLVVFGTHEVSADEITEWRYERAAKESQSESSDGSEETPLLPEGTVAWLRVNGTSIDYPVAQAHESDPFFYLSHDIWGNSSRSGCPFLDWRCSNARLQKLVYAHRMGTMGKQFSPIAETWRQEDFDRIGTLEWKTTDGISTFRPFCALRVDKTYQKIQAFDACSETELRNWLSNILCDSTARAADARVLCLGAQKAITLATCSSEQSGQRDRTLLVFVEIQPTSGESSP